MLETSEGAITAEENELISQLKREGVLRRFIIEEVRGKAKNGGVAFVCSDGDIDASIYHREISHRPHEIKLFGGPLLLAPSFSHFREADAGFILENMKLGMGLKRTRFCHLYFHAPCGLTRGRYSIPAIINMANEAKTFMLKNDFFLPEKIDLYLHVKRFNKAESLEQNSYLLAA